MGVAEIVAVDAVGDGDLVPDCRDEVTGGVGRGSLVFPRPCLPHTGREQGLPSRSAQVDGRGGKSMVSREVGRMVER